MADGLSGRSGKFGFDSGREGKLLAGGRLQVEGVFARWASTGNNYNLTTAPPPLNEHLGKAETNLHLRITPVRPAREVRGRGLSQVTKLEAQGCELLEALV